MPLPCTYPNCSRPRQRGLGQVWCKICEPYARGRAIAIKAKRKAGKFHRDGPEHNADAERELIHRERTGMLCEYLRTGK